MTYHEFPGEGVSRWPSLVAPPRARWLEGLLVGGKGPVPMLGHSRCDSAVLNYTQTKLALAAVTV